MNNFIDACAMKKAIPQKKDKPPPRLLTVNLYCYTLGKEEIFDGLARYYNTKIQLIKERYVK
jgi:hypothetical protein